MFSQCSKYSTWRIRPPIQSHRFKELGDLPGGIFDSVPKAISADGAVVVGVSDSFEGMEAFLWTRDGGMIGLGFPQCSAVTADGSAVFGYRLVPGRTRNPHAGPNVVEFKALAFSRDMTMPKRGVSMPKVRSSSDGLNRTQVTNDCLSDGLKKVECVRSAASRCEFLRGGSRRELQG